MAAVTSAALMTAGLVSSAAGATASFVQARKQRDLAEKAAQSATQAIEDARKRLDVNFYDKLAIPKEAYELQKEALLSAGAQAIQAGVEGQSRGVAPTAGRVYMAQNEAQGGIRTDMASKIMDLNKLSATEDSRLRDVNTQLDLATAEGAQLAARDANAASNRAVGQGIQQVQNTLQQGIEMSPLYGQHFGAQKSAVSAALADASLANIAGLDYNGTPVGKLDFSNMSNGEFKDFKDWLSPEQQNALFMSDPYINNYKAAQNGYNPFDLFR